MEITTELVNHLAELSRLEFSHEETENFKKEFEKTLNQIEALEKADTTNIETQVTILNAENELKEDTAQKSLSKNDAIKNAPDTMGSSIAVPMMVE
jgi:aspartyl-tRNA(Asn)/glutamyl-tRNA(Gln) amidotransferase subunit C